MEFIGRETELEFLKNKYKSNSPELIIVYGRRRLGKTMLLKESLKGISNSFYFLVTKDSSLINLYNFQDILSEKLGHPILSSINVRTWEEFFRYAIDYIPENFVIVLDEIPYLFNQSQALISQFQKIYDEYLKSKNIKLVLCGSSFSIMDEITSYQSPLYGRRTGKINLEPFTLYETKLFLKIDNIEEIFKYHLVFGGVPYYLAQIDTSKNFRKNIEKLFFSTTSIFDDEAIFLLKEEFREIKNYVSILRSISLGKNTYSLISQNVELNVSSLSSYLLSLEKLKLIKQNKSFFDKENSKKTRYEINDNFLFLWFRVFESYKRQIINEENKKKILNDSLPSNLGYLFEKECKRILSMYYEKVDSFFNKEGVEIDIIAEKENQFDLYESKFKRNVNEEKIILDLKEKSGYLPKNIKINSYNLISINKGITLHDLLEKSKEIYEKRS